MCLCKQARSKRYDKVHVNQVRETVDRPVLPVHNPSKFKVDGALGSPEIQG
jgi:hypothetical protein